MFRFIFLLSLVLLANGYRLHKLEHGKKHEKSNRIVGGQETTIEKRPYQVSLILSDATASYLCGGSILNSRWILTAAHCLQNGIIRVQVRAGSAKLYSGGSTFTTSVYKAHPMYSSVTNDYDVGLVDLTRNVLPLNNSTIKAVKLATAGSSLAAGTSVTVSGWGTTQENGQTSQTLMEVTVQTYDFQTCRNAYRSFTGRMICAGVPEGGKDSCQGDSGGPLVTNDNVQVGIVSYGIGCARQNYPGVYANVSALRSWIQLYTTL